jgi:hypothetical protein
MAKGIKECPDSGDKYANTYGGGYLPRSKSKQWICLTLMIYKYGL